MSIICHQVTDGTKGRPIINRVVNRRLSVLNSAGMLSDLTWAAIVAFMVGVGFLAAPKAHAGELLMQGPSVHFSNADRNSANFGLGYLGEHYAVGAYYNSYYKTTAYAALRSTPIHIDRLELGAVLGVGTGYYHKVLSPVGALTGRFALTEKWGVWVFLVPAANGVANFGVGYRW